MDSIGKPRKKIMIEDMTAEELMADSGSDTSNLDDEEQTEDLIEEEGEVEQVDEDMDDEISNHDDDEDNDENQDRITEPTRHKQSLERLRETDPEFYKYLQENDQELLEFEDSEGSSDEEGSVHELPTELEEQIDSDEEDYVDTVQRPKREGFDVTLAMVDKWRKQLREHSQRSLHEVIKAFRAAVHQITSDEEINKFRVEGSAVFNAIVSLCLKHVHPTLQNILEMEATPTPKKTLPHASKRWKQVQASVKMYLIDLLKLLKQMSETSIVCVVLRHIHRMVPYYCCYPRQTKDIVKRLVSLWSTGEEGVRVLSFLSLCSIHRSMHKSNWLEFILKQMYLAYVRNTKFTSPTTLPLINFMQRSLTEMFALSTQLAYQHGFVYIRQLAIHLRNAITVKKKDTNQSVYNWQYIHCLSLWCRILGTLHADEALRPLIYPLVQTAVGVIKLIPAARYYPLRFQVVRSLNLLSEATGTFIPLLPFLLEIFEMTDFNKKHGSVSFRPLNFAVMLRVSKSQLNERGFKDGLMDQLYDILLEHLHVHCHTISFPEFALPVILQLKEFLKKCKVANYCKMMKGLLDKIQGTSKEVTKMRDSVTFGISDTAAVKSWENSLKQRGTTLSKHYETYKKLRERELRHEEAGKEQMTEDIPTIKKRQLKKEEDKREFHELFDTDSDSEDDILVRAERKRERYTPSKSDRRGRGRKGGDNNDDGDDDDDDNDDLDDSEDEQVQPRVNPMSKVTGKVEVLADGEDIVKDFDLWSEDEKEMEPPLKKKKKLTKKKGKKERMNVKKPAAKMGKRKK